MASFPTLPYELLEIIIGHLVARDIAALSLSCRNLKDRLSSGNQYLWYSLIRRGLPTPESLAYTSSRRQQSDEYLGRLDLMLNSQNFKFDDRRDYWTDAVNIFSTRMVYGCCFCLKIAGHYNTFLRPKDSVYDGQAGKRCCTTCFINWFVDFSLFSSTFQEIPVPLSVIQYPTHGKALIYIPTAIKLIEEQCAPVAYEVARSVAYRFKVEWIAARGEQDAEYVEQALFYLKDAYTRQYRHIHVVLPPGAFYRLFTESLDDHILAEHPQSSERRVPQKSHAENILKIAQLLKEQEYNKAIEIVGAINRALFGNPNCFEPNCLEYPDSCVLLYRMSLYAAESPSAFGWVLLYSAVYFDSDTDNIRCYWCLRANNGKDTQDNRYHQHETARDIPWEDGFPDTWLSCHIMMNHQELTWKRPQNKMLYEHCFFLYGKVRIRANSPLEILKGTQIDFENEVLEDLPMPEGDLDRITLSSYFLM